ncbi:MAG: bifunctional hydroxymethylpyrimidine kinase/phosphomethylpyrimidine kinase, partial [Armatimonadota bacterium]|nr:bifunctional hydroxymethylpyrimidine kinase/phosphomethylpyrimidine kinase [Armatimonadota bacterium]
MTAVALTIAGSDPSGGAGVQADLRTFGALGVAGLSVITALTVQNSQGVQSVHPVAPDVLAAQLNAILSDTRPDAVKIGMLGTAAHVQVVAAALRQYTPPNIILDPVLASTGGVPLLDVDGRQALLSDLLPLCDLVTPNLDEASALTGLRVQDVSAMKEAARRLQTLGARYALVKGGHLHGFPYDVMPLSPTDSLNLQGTPDVWVDTPHKHGTGCLLSACIAAFLASGLSLHLSVLEAKRMVSEALRQPIVIGQGRGYPNVLWAAPRRLARIKHERRLPKLHEIYVVTDTDLRPDRTHLEIARAALAGGAKIIQLRDKRLPTRKLVALGKRLRQIVQKAGAQLIINDRVDVALACDADGVHLGPDDMLPEEARRLLG